LQIIAISTTELLSGTNYWGRAHLVKTWEYTLNLLNLINNRNVNMATLILRDTHRALEEKMESLDKLKKETSLKIRDAASHGDLKENAEYHAAREEQSLIIRKTQLLQTHSPFQIIEYSEIETDMVGFGNKVTIHEEGKDEAEDYYLLGPIEFELDLYPLVVTIHSPFGQAIVGKKIDEDFTLEIRGKETKFTITAIEKISAEL